MQLKSPLNFSIQLLSDPSVAMMPRVWVRGPVSRDGFSLRHSLSFGGCISFLWLLLQTWVA